MTTNPNDPINPTSETISWQEEDYLYLPFDAHTKGMVTKTQNIHHLGLTKRELISAMAMQGLLQNYIANGMYGNSVNYPMVEEAAVRCADQLITELNKHNDTTD